MDALIRVASKLRFVHPWMQGCALDTTLLVGQCCIQSASLHPGTHKYQFVDAAILSQCVHLDTRRKRKLICKFGEYYRKNTKAVAIVCFISSIVSRSPNFVPRVGLQNDAKRDFARITWCINNPETLCLAWCSKWRQITNVIATFRDYESLWVFWERWYRRRVSWLWSSV